MKKIKQNGEETVCVKLKTGRGRKRKESREEGSTNGEKNKEFIVKDIKGQSGWFPIPTPHTKKSCCHNSAAKQLMI